MDTDTVQVRVAEHVEPQDNDKREQQKQQKAAVQQSAQTVQDTAWRRGCEVLKWRY